MYFLKCKLCSPLYRILRCWQRGLIWFLLWKTLYSFHKQTFGWSSDRYYAIFRICIQKHEINQLIHRTLKYFWNKSYIQNILQIDAVLDASFLPGFRSQVGEPDNRYPVFQVRRAYVLKHLPLFRSHETCSRKDKLIKLIKLCPLHFIILFKPESKIWTEHQLLFQNIIDVQINWSIWFIFLYLVVLCTLWNCIS